MRSTTLLFLTLLIIPAAALADQPLMPVAVEFEGPSDSSYATNTVIDILTHNSGVWLASGRGLNATYDGGASWLLYDRGAGMVSQNISAAFSYGGRLWAATSHTEKIDGTNYSISDGLSYSDDDGETWTQIDFSETGQDIPWVWGGDRTIFDIGGAPGAFDGRDWMFAAAFAGGLLASQDGGMNWRRIYPSVGDSIQYNDTNQQPSFRNRYFSAVADTSHGDSLFAWTGTAGGVFQYIYAPARNRLSSKNIFAVTACDQCSDSAAGFVYLGGEGGLSRGKRTGGSFITRAEDDGLPASQVTAVFVLGDRLLAGTQDVVTRASTGLAVSTDYGETYTPVSFSGDGAFDALVQEFATIGDRLYMAAGSAGLQVSIDTGDTWTPILFDSVNTDAAYNHANGLATIGDSLLIGTDSGLVCLTFTTGGVIQDRKHIDFPDNVFFGSKIIRVRVQPFENDSIPGQIDSTAYWTVNREVDPAGSPMIARSNDLNDDLSWASYWFDTLSYDIGFIGDTAFLVGQVGVKYSVTGSGTDAGFIDFSVVDSVNSGWTMNQDTVYTIRTMGDTLYLGSSNGLAVSTDAGASFAIYRGIVDSLKADVVVNHYTGNTIYVDTAELILGLTGDFIPALGVQYRTDGPAHIWASGRPVGTGIQGISVGFWVDVEDTLGNPIGKNIRWRALYGGDFAWNFAFWGDSVFAATNSGVLVNWGDTSEVWDTLVFENAEGLEFLRPGTPAYAISVVGDDLWVGTGDGTVRYNISNPTDQEVFTVVDSVTSDNEVYAFPTPFSPNRGGECDFRFVVNQDAYVTVEVYDFAMNLVARPIDNVFYPAGYYPDGNYQRLTWDGYNGEGDIVAVGVYYFKVEYSTGEARWGKLAVIP